MTKNVHLFCVWIVVCFVAKATCEDFEFMILHNNDMHGRFEETERNSATCKDSHKNVSCIGGMARTAHEIRRYRQLAAEGKGPPVIFLNAGDIYVGTTWFNLFTWNISAAFLNLLEPDAICLGNHEFDFGLSALTPFVEAINSPILAANAHFQTDNTIINTKVTKSTILQVSDHKIGVIGYITPQTTNIAQPETTTFTDEIEAITSESEALAAAGVNIIIALGHSGYATDLAIAANVPLVDVVVGGHSHSLLSNAVQQDTEVPVAEYPKVVTQTSGKPVLVVQAYAYTKYLGQLNVTFNDAGDLVKFGGDTMLLEPSVEQDSDVLELLEIYRPQVEALNEEVVGRSGVVLEATANLCRREECNFGNLVTDAYVVYTAASSMQHWTHAPIALYNGGNVRNTIDPFGNGGNVTRGELLAAVPYGNQILTLTLLGEDLVQVLEQGIRSNGETSNGEFLQVSGLRVVYDKSKPAMSRVVSVKARCGECGTPVYANLDPAKNYTIITSDFLANGGDGHTVLRDKGFNRVAHDLIDVEIIVWYFQRYSPVYPQLEGRIEFVENSTDGEEDGGSENDGGSQDDGGSEDNGGQGNDNGSGSAGRFEINNMLNIVLLLSLLMYVLQ